MTHSSSRILALVAMLIMLVLYSLTALGYMGPNPVGQTATYDNPLIVPAGYAFSIWGLIYTALIAFPIFQLIKKRTEHSAWIPLRQWYALNVVLNGVWLVAVSYDYLWTSLIIIATMLLSLYRINELLIQIRKDDAPVNYWAERIGFSLYFAWITLATGLNVSAALAFYNWDGFGLSALNWAIIMLPVLALVGGLVFRKYRDIAYAGVVVWAFVALVVRHWEAYPILAYIAIGVAVLFIALMFIAGKKWAVKV